MTAWSGAPRSSGMAQRVLRWAGICYDGSTSHRLYARWLTRSLARLPVARGFELCGGQGLGSHPDGPYRPLVEDAYVSDLHTLTMPDDRCERKCRFGEGGVISCTSILCASTPTTLTESTYVEVAESHRAPGHRRSKKKHTARYVFLIGRWSLTAKESRPSQTTSHSNRHRPSCAYRSTRS